MKSRISFFDKTVFRKDITRFAPLWSVYFIGGVLVMLTVAANTDPGNLASNLNSMIGPFSIINILYAALCAQLLFGDLFNARMCNALHAMPLRRETWYLSHVAAGLCFSVVPIAVRIFLVMPILQQFWYTGLLWLLGMTLHYLFFFGLAVLSCLCTGNRFAMAAVYTIVNFISPLTKWFVQTFYEPMLRGVILDSPLFDLLCPVSCLSGSDDYFGMAFDKMNDRYGWRFAGMGGDWLYLAITAAVGLGMLVLALVLYRRRALESAGDFMAVRPLIPVFSLVYTLCVGAVFAMVGELLADSFGVFLLMGLVIGFFTGQMLTARTVKVFRKKTFFRLGVLVAAMLATLLVTKLDPLGITRWTPNADQVVSMDVNSGYYGYFSDTDSVTVRDPEQIGQLIEIHEQILEKGEPSPWDQSVTVNLRYRLKDGRQVTRSYLAPKSGAYFEPLKELYSRPEWVLGYGEMDWEEYLDRIETVYVDGYAVESDALCRELLEAIRADCEAGTMLQEPQFRESDEYSQYWIDIEYRAADGDTRFWSVRVYTNCTNACRWLEEHMDSLKTDPQ